MIKNLQKDPIITEPRIWLSMALALIPMLVLFYRPTLLEFLSFYLIDLVGYMICQASDISIYRRIWPRSRLYFPDLDPEIMQLHSLEEKKAVYSGMLRFPRDRACFIGIMSAIKVIPGLLFILIVWRGEDPLWMACVKCLSITAFTFSFLIGMSYMGYHNRISSQLQEVHAKADWSEVFKDIDLVPHHRLFLRFEILAAVSVWIFWTLVIGLIVTTPGLRIWEALLQAFLMSTTGFYFIAQLSFTSRKQIMQGLEEMMRLHNEGIAQSRFKGLALSTNPTLAFYQKTLNELIERNVEHEKEIHRWILRKAEDSRYLQLGRLAGLLVHDLVTPLTVMRYSLAVLDEQNAFQGPHQAYAERLRFSLDQTTDFIKNIRSSIRDHSTGYHEASILIAHGNAQKMVSYLYDPTKFSAITMDCQLESDFMAAIPQPELNQVLLNLYSNAAKNLIDYGITNPRISMRLLQQNQESFTLVIKDNGSGLSATTFEYMTEEAERLPGYEGIGLKLIKRLIELYGGNLRLIQPLDQVGSEFHLILRKASPHVNPQPPPIPIGLPQRLRTSQGESF